MKCSINTHKFERMVRCIKLARVVSALIMELIFAMDGAMTRWRNGAGTIHGTIPRVYGGSTSVTCAAVTTATRSRRRKTSMCQQHQYSQLLPMLRYGKP